MNSEYLDKQLYNVAEEQMHVVFFLIFSHRESADREAWKRGLHRCWMGEL